MNYKLHAAILLTILATIVIIWQVLTVEPVKTTFVEPESAYKVQVSRATYGLACKEYYNNYKGDAASEEQIYMDPYGEKQAEAERKLKENNAIKKVKEICEGEVGCSFQVSPKTLGFDPFPGCGLKDLRIEYRCYTVDRLRRVTFRERDQAQVICRNLGR